MLIEQHIFGTNCLIRSKTAIVNKILKLNRMISEIIVRKRIKVGIFGNYHMDYLTEFDLCIRIVLTEYIICVKILFLKVDVRK